MVRFALPHVAIVWQSAAHELSRLTWLTIVSVATRSFGIWIDALD
jgi:hypothetical protein